MSQDSGKRTVIAECHQRRPIFASWSHVLRSAYGSWNSVSSSGVFRCPSPMLTDSAQSSKSASLIKSALLSTGNANVTDQCINSSVLTLSYYYGKYWSNEDGIPQMHDLIRNILYYKMLCPYLGFFTVSFCHEMIKKHSNDRSRHHCSLEDSRETEKLLCSLNQHSL